MTSLKAKKSSIQVAEKAAANAKELPPLPFDLTNLMSVQFDNLKAAIEYLARQQGEQQLLINELVTMTPGTVVTEHRARSGLGRTPAPSESQPTGMEAAKKIASELDIQLSDDDIGVSIATLKTFVDTLLEKEEKNEIRFEELEDRVQRMELSSGVRDQLVRKVQNDLGGMIDRMNKVENTSKVKGAMEAAGMDSASINLVLEAINDMQDRVTSQTNEKLEKHAKVDEMKDMKNELEILTRRITFSEGIIQENEKNKREFNEKVDINRVRLQKIINEMEILKRTSKSALSISQAANDAAKQGVESAIKLEDLAGLDMSGDGVERLINMIKLLESNTQKQIGSLDRKVSRLMMLESDVEFMKNNGAGIELDPKKRTGGFSGAQLEQFNKLIEQVQQLTEKMLKLEIDYEALEGAKMKHDLSDLKRAAQSFVSAESVERMTEDVKQFRNTIAGLGFDIQNIKDHVTKNEKTIESNQKEHLKTINNVRVGMEDMDNRIQGDGKKINSLDDKFRSYMKNAALMGGGNYGGGNVVEEIEENIRKLREELDDLKKSSSSEFVILRNDLGKKLTKDDGAQIETRITTYLESVVLQMKTMFLEKEPLQKRLNKVDRNIRLLKNEVEAIKDKEPDEDTGMFTKRMLSSQHQCASCEKNIKNLLTGAADHQNWNKLPFHKPNENIARYGSGFSKILQQMKPSDSEAQIIANVNEAAAPVDTKRSRNFDNQQSQNKAVFQSPTKKGKFNKRGGSVQPDEDINSIQQYPNDVNLSTLSPNPSGTINYNGTLALHDDSTQDMSRFNAYKSAAKIKMGKRHASIALSPTQQSHQSVMKPIKNPTWDEDNAGFPRVKGAFK